MTDAAKDDAPLRVLAELAENVDAFARRVESRHELSCGPGCSACCEVSLAVGVLEASRVRGALAALEPGRRAAVRARTVDPRVTAEERCVMLDEAGRCDVYEARPLVCRSQGLPLLYPLAAIPPEARAAEAELPDGPRAIVWCPLNFAAQPPESEDLLDAERVDVALARLTRAHARGERLDPLRRVSLIALARAADDDPVV